MASIHSHSNIDHSTGGVGHVVVAAAVLVFIVIPVGLTLMIGL